MLPRCKWARAQGSSPLGPGRQHSTGNWVETSFRRTASWSATASSHAKVESSIARAFGDYFGELVDTWAETWGYTRASLRPPSRHSPATGDLLKHCLKFHAREVVYQLREEALDDVGAATFEQDEDDRERVQQAMTLLDEAARVAEPWCVREKVRS